MQVPDPQGVPGRPQPVLSGPLHHQHEGQRSDRGNLSRRGSARHGYRPRVHLHPPDTPDLQQCLGDPAGRRQTAH